jgi:hypothetical protein
MSDRETERAHDAGGRTPLPDGTPPRFQFSLAWLLIAVTVVAVLLGFSQLFNRAIIEAVGGTLLTAIVGCILPTPLVVAALFARGDVRVFSIGALVPWIMNRGVPLYTYAYRPSWPVWILLAGSTIYILVTAAFCGFVAVAACRWIQRRGYGS